MRQWIDLLEDKTFPLKDGKMISLSHHYTDGGEDREDEPYISVLARLDGDIIGSCLYDPEDEIVRGVTVDEPYRRLGVATAIYDYLVGLYFPVQPSYNQEPDGEAFWADRKNKKNR